MHSIFRGFIEKERNEVINEHRIPRAVAAKTTYQTLAIDLLLIADQAVSADAAVAVAIKWWEGQLEDIEAAAASAVAATLAPNSRICENTRRRTNDVT